jgi:hypothetical protein
MHTSSVFTLSPVNTEDEANERTEERDVHKGNSGGKHERRLSVPVLVRRERLAHHDLEPADNTSMIG